jgi:hypothetical protein
MHCRGGKRRPGRGEPNHAIRPSPPGFGVPKRPGVPTEAERVRGTTTARRAVPSNFLVRQEPPPIPGWLAQYAMTTFPVAAPPSRHVACGGSGLLVAAPEPFGAGSRRNLAFARQHQRVEWSQESVHRELHHRAVLLVKQSGSPSQAVLLETDACKAIAGQSEQICNQLFNASTSPVDTTATRWLAGALTWLRNLWNTPPGRRCEGRDRSWRQEMTLRSNRFSRASLTITFQGSKRDHHIPVLIGQQFRALRMTGK